MKNYAIAIDGPAGGGKSTVAKGVAKALGLIHIDTGAMYRAVGLFCIRKEVDTKNNDAISEALKTLEISIKIEDGKQKIFIEKEDVSDLIRTQEVGQKAAYVANNLAVREKLVELQRELAKGASVIMDGRDIGTNVLKDAEIKIYLSASVEERGKRRMNEYNQNGKNNEELNFEKICEEIQQRDYMDMTREHNPLTKATDAIEIDSTKLNINEVIEKIIEIKREKIGAE